MRRRLFTLCSAVWLVLCVALCVLWLRSGVRVDVIGYDGPAAPGQWQRGGYVSSSTGEIDCEWWLRQNPPMAGPEGATWAYNSWGFGATANISDRPWHGFGYRFDQGDNSRPRSDGLPTAPLTTYSHKLVVPYWFVLLLATYIAWTSLRRTVRLWKAASRQTNGLCPACGYDLRASPGRCPECGMVSALAVAPNAHD